MYFLYMDHDTNISINDLSNYFPPQASPLYFPTNQLIQDHGTSVELNQIYIHKWQLV